MASKWSTLKDTLPAFTQEPSWQQEIDQVKTNLTGKSRLELCGNLHDLDLEKKDLKAKLHEVDTHLEAIHQLLVPTMEESGETKFTNSFGTFYLKDEPYSKVVDKVAYLGWIRSRGLEALLSVPYATTNAQVKTLLEAGAETPPGLEVFLKTTVGRRSA